MSGEGATGFSPDVISRITVELKNVISRGISVAVVIGGGNILRGRDISHLNMDRTTADYAGMLATVINGIVLNNWFNDNNLPSDVYSSFQAGPGVQLYDPRTVRAGMDEGRVAVLTGGTGCTHFSTDTSAVLRASELGVDLLIKGTDVNGVYDGDPDTDETAKPYVEITYGEYLKKGLRVMDMTAICLALEFGIPIIVYKFGVEGDILRILDGERVGTLIRG